MATIQTYVDPFPQFLTRKPQSTKYWTGLTNDVAEALPSGFDANSYKDFPVFVPFFTDQTVTFDRLSLFVTSSSATTFNFKITMYSDLNGFPYSKLFTEAAGSATTGPAFKDATIAGTLKKGAYWFCFNNDLASARSIRQATIHRDIFVSLTSGGLVTAAATIPGSAARVGTVAAATDLIAANVTGYYYYITAGLAYASTLPATVASGDLTQDFLAPPICAMRIK